MSEVLWNLFRETGDPMGYLLYRAEKKSKQREKPDAGVPKENAGKGPPPASA